MRHQELPLAEHLKRESHRICAMILNSDEEWIDIAIQIEALRAVCLAEESQKAELFEALYVRRFERLWQQWRANRDARGGYESPHWIAEFGG